MKTIYVLGQKYTVTTTTEEKDVRLHDADGICDKYSKEIVIRDLSEESKAPDAVRKFEDYVKKILRHEIIHAYFFESGMDVESSYALNEELVDWMAIQLPKIAQTCEKLKVL